MLFTASSGADVSLTAIYPPTTALLLLRAVALGVVELLAFHDGLCLDLRPDDVAHRRDPPRHDLPLLAVPLLDQQGSAALVVLAGDLDRVREALHAELVEPLLRQVEVLESPPDLLAREHLVAVLAHRGANRLDGEHGVDNAAIVERGAHLLLLPGTLALVIDVLDDVLEDPEVGARSMECRSLVSLGAVPGGDHVGVAGGPPVADEVVHPETGGRCLLDRDLVHHAPAGQEDPVRIEPADLEPCRLLLLAGMVHGEQRQLEAVFLRQLLEGRVGLLAVRTVVID